MLASSVLYTHRATLDNAINIPNFVENSPSWTQFTMQRGGSTINRTQHSFAL